MEIMKTTAVLLALMFTLVSSESNPIQKHFRDSKNETMCSPFIGKNLYFVCSHTLWANMKCEYLSIVFCHNGEMTTIRCGVHIYDQYKKQCMVAGSPECPMWDAKFQDKDDPHKYWLCKGGGGRLTQCPSNQIFDDMKQRCIGNDIVTTPKSLTTSSSIETMCSSFIGKKIYLVCSNTLYENMKCEYLSIVYCHDGQMTTIRCGVYIFDQYKNQCMVAGSPECPMWDAKFQDKDDPHKYWLCKGGGGRLTNCPSNQIFDDIKQRCV